MAVRILAGDVRARLRMMEAESVHCIVTSPPYWGLRDYHAAGQIGLEPSPLAWVAVMVKVFREIRRVLRKDGTVWLNVGDKYAGSGCGGDTGYSGLEGSASHQEEAKSATKLRQADEIAATQRQGAVTNIGRRATRGSREPAGLHETARKDGTLSRAWQKPPPGFRDKQRLMLPARLALALQDDGWWLRDEIIWHKPNPMPSSTTDRTTPAHEMVYLLTRSPVYFFDAVAIAEEATFESELRYERGRSETHKWADGGPGGQTIAKGFEHMRRPVPSGWDEEEGRHDQGRYAGRRSGNKARVEAEERSSSPNSHVAASVPWEGRTRNKRSVWSIATEPFGEAHFATFPTKLVEPCILAGTSQRGACPECGAPWRRVVRVDYANPGNRTTNGHRSEERKHIENGTAGYDVRLEKEMATLGWYPSCDCLFLRDLPKLPRRAKDETQQAWRERRPAAMAAWEAEVQPLLDLARGFPTRPCTVLDPFLGAGTTALVADRLGRDAVGIELNPDFVEMARRRITADAPLVTQVEVVTSGKPRRRAAAPGLAAGGGSPAPARPSA